MTEVAAADVAALRAQLAELTAALAAAGRREAERAQGSPPGPPAALLHDLLPVVDSLHLATQDRAPGQDPAADALATVCHQLEAVLTAHGVVALACRGEFYDPERHEALAPAASAGGPNVVVRELARGYLLHGRLLRRAQVVLSPARRGAGDGG